MIEIVSATRLSEELFWKSSALGISLRRLARDRLLRSHIVFENSQGLPQIYNARLVAAQAADVIVFIHDDVWIDDYFFSTRVADAMQRFDVVGVAGNRRLTPSQPGWPFCDEFFTRDDESNLSGSVAHAKGPFGPIAFFGATPAPCELLDGVLLAVNASAMRRRDVQFDPRFDFHFYDLDFCRSARCAGLNVGTWPIAITHQSAGAFRSQAWERKYREYQAKWERP